MIMILRLRGYFLIMQCISYLVKKQIANFSLLADLLSWRQTLSNSSFKIKIHIYLLMNIWWHNSVLICKVNYVKIQHVVNMLLIYVYIRVNYVNMQHNYVDMPYNYANLRYFMQFRLQSGSTLLSVKQIDILNQLNVKIHLAYEGQMYTNISIFQVCDSKLSMYQTPNRIYITQRFINGAFIS